jgi:hypothetical protein
MTTCDRAIRPPRKRGEAKRQRCLETHRAFGGEIAEQQSCAQKQHGDRSAEFDSLQQQRALAVSMRRQTTRQTFRAHRNQRDRRHCYRRAEPHDEGRGHAGPEQALRQRKHQNKDRTGTRTQADCENRADATRPAAGTGQLVRIGPVIVAAMLVMHMARLAMRGIVAVGVIVVGVTVMIMAVIVVRMAV